MGLMSMVAVVNHLDFLLVPMGGVCLVVPSVMVSPIVFMEMMNLNARSVINENRDDVIVTSFGAIKQTHAYYGPTYATRSVLISTVPVRRHHYRFVPDLEHFHHH